MDLENFFAKQNQKKQLKILTCGSVDDGKSTLLGRLLYDSQNVFIDQLQQTKTESQKYGTQGKEIDLALLIDGLQAEREQGITIDVAYRYFETEKCKFIIADAPGHEEYTRNMATGASNADIAIILIDSTKGVLEQTRRHSFIISLLNIKNVIVAVNKMDLVEFKQDIFNQIINAYKQLAKNFYFQNIEFIPVSALTGENIFSFQNNMPWYKGKTLIDTLEGINLKKDSIEKEFSMPVQWVNRTSSDFRGFSGTIVSGFVKKGMMINILPSSQSSTVKEILGPSGSIEKAIVGQSITITLDTEVDISRGDLFLSKNNNDIVLADQFASHLIWMDNEKMLPERNYILRFINSYVTGQITDLTHSININSYEEVAAKTLKLNEIGYCKIALNKAIPFTSYKTNFQLGSFVLIDQFTNKTIGAGMIDHALRRANNISWHQMILDKNARSKMNAQKPCVIWFTGLSGSGKSTIANILEQKLYALNKRTYLLDGDNVRHGLNKDLGFTDTDRVENIRRVSEVSKLMTDAGLITLVSFISPFRSEREMARNLLPKGEFIEIFVNTSLEECEKRDPKGLYAKARSGKLKNFTGIDSNYEKPESAEIILDTILNSPEILVDQIINYLKENNRI